MPVPKVTPALTAPLEESQRRFRGLIRALAQTDWRAAPDGTVTHLHGWCEFTGQPEGEQLGTGWTRMIHEDDRAGVATVWAASVATGRDYDHTYRVRFHLGGHRWIRARGVAIRSARGEIVEWIGIVTDIDQHKRDEAARELATAQLRTSEELYRALTEHSDELHAIIDSARVMRYASPSVLRVLGFERTEMEGHPLAAFVHPDDITAAQSLLETVLLAPDATASVTIRMRHKDGSWRYIEGSGTNLHHLPAVRGVSISARDVTARWELEDQLRQSQKMEAVGQLAGGVAHDFNNILTAIMAYNELLLEDAGQGTQMRDDLMEIRHAARRAADLTRQLLAFSRKQIMHTEPLDICAVIRDMEKMLGRLISENILLDAACAEQSVIVSADRAQLEQVVLNLAVNARDAMMNGGRLHISVGSEGPVVTMRVSDTGTGMSAATRTRIFEPFFTTKPAGKGTGLGLSVVYGIVQQLKGSIEVESEEGVGTTFIVRLPAGEGEHAQAVGEVMVGDRGQETILLVEDNEPLAEIGKRVLEQLGYRVLSAANGAEAERLALASRVDLMVTDVVMPAMSGPALVERLQRRGVKPRVLFTSGYPGEDVFAIHGIGADRAFIAKPWTPLGLSRAVRALLDSGEN